MSHISIQEMTPKERKLWEKWLETCKRIEEGSVPDRSETLEQKKKRIKKLLKPQNFHLMVDYYFKTEGEEMAEFAWFHKKAIENVIVKKGRKHLFEWPRETAKSVLTDIFFPIWLLVTGWLDGLVLASENNDKAKNLIKDIQAHLMHNQKLINDFGDFGITGSWMQGFFQTGKGVGFWAFGLGQNPAGVRVGFKRPNLGIVDDADSYQAAKNQERTKARVEWIKGEFMGCLQTLGSIFIYANNRVHRQGLTAHMAGDIEPGDPVDPSFNHIKVFWTENPDTHEKLMPEEGGVPCWSRYSKEAAQNKIDDMGRRTAMRQLYHEHITEGKVFKEEMLPWATCRPLHEYDALATYCDPAFGESGKGCYRSIVLVGKRGLLYDVIYAWLEKVGSFAQEHYRIAEMVRNNSPLLHAAPGVGFRMANCRHYVEANGLQIVHVKKAYREENEKRGKPWFPRYDNDRKLDKLVRIESLEPLASHGHLRFNKALRDNHHLRRLREQFLDFPEGDIDGPDSVQGAIEKLETIKPPGTAAPRGGKYKRSTARLG